MFSTYLYDEFICILVSKLEINRLGYVFILSIITSSYISTLIQKLFPNYTIIPYVLFKDIYSFNECTLYKNYLLQHTELHRLYDKEKVKLPYISFQNQYLYCNNELALYAKKLDIPSLILIYNELISRKLWLITSHMNKTKVTFYLLDIYNYVPSNAVCVMDITKYSSAKSFADEFIQTIHVRYKKYLERVYLSSINSFIAIRDS